MASFVMMQPPAATSGDPDLPVAVRDGFSVLAFLVPPLWLAWNRLWVEAAVALAAMVLLNVVGVQSGMGAMATLLSLLISLWAGLENAAMRIAGMRRRGFVEIGVVEASSRDDAELRYADWADADTDVVDAPGPWAPVPRPIAVRPLAPPAPAIGLVTFQGKR